MATENANPRHSRLGGWLRIAASAVVLAAIFSLVPLHGVLEAMRQVEWQDWLIALVVFLIGHVVSAAKWQLLAAGGESFATVLGAHFSGLIANLCLPGVAGGDVVRAGMLYPRAADKAQLALGSIADRLIDTLGLLLIAAAGLVIALPRLASGMQVLVAIGCLLAACVAAGVLGAWQYPRLMQRLPAGGRLRRIAEQAGRSVASLWRRPRQLALCLVLSLAVQLAFIGVNVMLAGAAGVDVPLAAWLFAWPLSKLVATLPISAGGIGVREASLAGFLAPFGAPTAAVIATGLLWQTVLLAAALLGGLFFLLMSHRVVRHNTPSADGT